MGPCGSTGRIENGDMFSTTPPGTVINVELPDGTRILLNAPVSVKFPVFSKRKTGGQNERRSIILK